MDTQNNTTIIAVCGKGGVGKTSVSALLAGILAKDKCRKVLAIDADPAVGLATALGFSAERTIDDIRNDLIENVKKGKGGDAGEVVRRIDYEVFSALEEKDNLAFLAIGRPETEGCYCRVNSFLKDVISSIAAEFDYVIIDGEAGIEQVNRRVMEKVTHLLLVSDYSAKGLGVVQTIHDVSARTVPFREAHLLLNRIRSKEEASRVKLPPALNLLGVLPEDDTIRDFDIEGRSLLELPACPTVAAMEGFIERLALSTAENEEAILDAACSGL